MLIAYVLIFLFVMLLSFFVCQIMKRYAADYFGLVDSPSERKIHERPIPSAGGIGIFVGVVGFFAICQLIIFVLLQFPTLVPESISIRLDGLMQRSFQLWTLLGLSTIMMLLGAFDDRFNLHWLIRILVQTTVAIVAVWQGWRLTIFIDFPILTSILSVIWIVGLTNSFNMLDNMNGLSGGIAVICGSFLATVMFISPNPESLEPQFFVAGFLIVLIASIIGFLLHNNPFYASLFMGNSGSYFIGFLMSILTLIATFTSDDQLPQTIFVPIIILAVPLYDMISVITIRIKNGKSPFEGDKNHFSHRLVKLGMSRTQSVLTIYLATIICCIGAILLYQVNFYGAILIVLQTIMTLSIIAILELTAKYKDNQNKNDT
ncbi:MAG: undecaprenyl/decaprenyl-phosphate alpha-N-acetylglucosaminyl 1-phosphate transferase [Planctomycetaceae bacterium]|jgi:UDP-GlcNAc:undecaprenyl-phosphate GlcNAc-1-phosphate transferase|nr:undecaprenyl/decaprenyl-phosphate alpha-N-acetylglucosaminyl 1-phosphate transferase [Planctomycetaceae bacterium]